MKKKPQKRKEKKNDDDREQTVARIRCTLFPDVFQIPPLARQSVFRIAGGVLYTWVGGRPGV